jgi:hypothetical protein
VDEPYYYERKNFERYLVYRRGARDIVCSTDSAMKATKIVKALNEMEKANVSA